MRLLANYCNTQIYINVTQEAMCPPFYRGGGSRLDNMRTPHSKKLFHVLKSRSDVM